MNVHCRNCPNTATMEKAKSGGWFQLRRLAYTKGTIVVHLCNKCIKNLKLAPAAANVGPKDKSK